jgi:hypothetical protein
VYSSESKLASAQLTAAIRSDLVACGYYRKEQTISISLIDEDDGPFIQLLFDSTLVPLRERARVDKPTVEAPANAELASPPSYSINGESFEDEFQPISEQSSERLTVRYRVLDRSNISVTDVHYWSSSVLQYKVRFAGAGHALKIWRLNGRKHGERIGAADGKSSGFTEVVGNGAAFTAQGLKWQLSALVDDAQRR